MRRIRRNVYHSYAPGKGVDGVGACCAGPPPPGTPPPRCPRMFCRNPLCVICRSRSITPVRWTPMLGAPCGRCRLSRCAAFSASLCSGLPGGKPMAACCIHCTACSNLLIEFAESPGPGAEICGPCRARAIDAKTGPPPAGGAPPGPAAPALGSGGGGVPDASSSMSPLAIGHSPASRQRRKLLPDATFSQP